MVLGLVEREGRWFLQRRDPASSVLPGLWEFPGGKAEADEAPEAALRRELAEEVDWIPERCAPLAPLAHAYADRSVVLHPFRCEGAGTPRTELAWGWFSLAEIRRLPIPPANAPLLDLLEGAP